MQRLMSALKQKFTPFTKLERYRALDNLKSVKFADKYDIVKFTEGFKKQINILNGEKEILSDELARMFFISEFDQQPNIKTILTQFELDCEHNKRPITLDSLLDHANHTVCTNKTKTYDVDGFKRHERYRHNRMHPYRRNSRQRNNQRDEQSDSPSDSPSDSQSDSQSDDQSDQSDSQSDDQSDHEEAPERRGGQQTHQSKNNQPKFRKDRNQNSSKRIASIETCELPSSDDEPPMVKAMKSSISQAKFN